MACVLTLIGDHRGRLTAPLADTVRAALHAAGGRTAPADWLSPEHACDIAVGGLAPSAAAAAARAALGAAPVDAVAQDGGHRMKRLLVADMDSTIVADETLDRMAALAGIGEAVLPITARAMNGEIDFAEALRQRVALLAGRPAGLIDAAIAQTRLTPGARALVATLRRAGAHTALVSGGFQPFADRVRRELGFDEAHANRLEVEGDRLTGRLIGEIVTRETKVALLHRRAAERGVPPAATLTVGDGANDLPMLLAAGLGVGFRAKPAVRRAAPARIDHADLTALLYLQGYRDAEIAWPEDERLALAADPPAAAEARTC